MPKVTKTLGHNKALAWESRGFVQKKRECAYFDTPSCLAYSPLPRHIPFVSMPSPPLIVTAFNIIFVKNLSPRFKKRWNSVNDLWVSQFCFWPFRRKTSKRRGYTNFGQSSVTKTLPPPLQVRIGKSGSEQCKIRPEFRGLPPAKVLRWKETGK